MSQKPVFIGMDLGSFKTSIACSNGERHVIPTTVGWPKDAIGRRMLGRDVVFGPDLESYRHALKTIRPFEKGAIKFVDSRKAGLDSAKVARHLEAARLIVNHAVELVKPAKGVPRFGMIGAPSQANLNTQQMILAAAQSAFDVAIVVHEPFAVGYGMNRLDRTLVVDIGAGTIDICPMFGAYPTAEQQLTIPLGGDLIDTAILKEIKEQFPDAACSIDMARKFKETFGGVRNDSESVMVSLAVSGVPRQFDIGPILSRACERFVAPIVRGVWHVVSQVAPEYQRTLMDNIVLGGGGSQLAGLDRRLERALEKHGGAKVTKAYDSVFAGATGALKLAMDTPMSQWERVVGQNRAA